MNEFKRKQWARIGLSLLALIAATLFLSGIIGGKNLVFSSLETKEASEAGFGGTVTVKAGVKGNKVQKLTVETPDETEGLGKKASEDEFITQFIGKEAPFAYGEDGIEAISGATVTSDAVLRALNFAVTGVAPEATAVPEPAQEAPAAEEPAQEAAAPEKAYDYSVQRETDFSIIRVSANAAEGKITECAISSEGKAEGTDFLTDEIREKWAKAIVENQTAETDAITGATLKFSSGAVREATAEILAQAGIAGAAEVPAVTEELQVTEAPAATEEPAATEAPAATEEPAATEAPAATEEPQVTEAPAATEEPAAEVPAAAEEAPAAEKAAEDSKFSGAGVISAVVSEKETDYSVIRVLLAMQGGKITDCVITSEGKAEGTDFLTDELREKWADAIVENQTAETDVITGATLKASSGAVQEAVAEIMKDAGIAAEPAAAEAPAATEEPAAEAPAAAEEAPAAEKAAEDSKFSGAGVISAVLSEKETDYSVIRVLLAMQGGRITDCVITSEAKGEGTDFLTDEIRKKWADAIVKNQTAETDAITGATLKFSAGAVQEAVKEILADLNQ